MIKLYKLLGVELVEVSAPERLIAAAGGGLSIFILFALTHQALPDTGAIAVLASMGATAVLLFSVPHGQLSQPWPVIAGHFISSIAGVSCAQYIAYQPLAAACAVGVAIGAMYQFKCIHPPGGATAFTAVMGGEAIHELGYHYVLFPVLTNAIVMVLLAIVINSAFKWRRYPAALNVAPTPPGPQPVTAPPTHEEVVTAIKSLDSFVDISEEDLVRLARILAPERR